MLHYCSKECQRMCFSYPIYHLTVSKCRHFSSSLLHPAYYKILLSCVCVCVCVCVFVCVCVCVYVCVCVFIKIP